METPSPVPNDSGAELAADDDIEIVKVNQGETFSLNLRVSGRELKVALCVSNC